MNAQELIDQASTEGSSKQELYELFYADAFEHTQARNNLTKILRSLR